MSLVRSSLLVFLLVSIWVGNAAAVKTSDRLEVLEDYHGYFPCNDCHADQETNALPRVLEDEHYEPMEWEDDDGVTHVVEFGELVSFAQLLGQTPATDRRGANLVRVGRQLQVEQYMEDYDYSPQDSVWVLVHGGANLWCLDCHDLDDRDRLRKLNGELLTFNESHLLCGQRHGPVLRDWDVGLHGRTSGYWDLQMDQDETSVRLLCVECHISHAPTRRPMQPLAGPVTRLDTVLPAHFQHEQHRGERDELGPHQWQQTTENEESKH